MAILADDLRVIHTALYLPGGPRTISPVRRAWPSVLECVRIEGAGISEASPILHRRGFALEALLLEDQQLLDWAAEQVEEGRCLLACDPHFPAGWRALGGRCAPAFWLRGEMPSTKECLALVGRRNPSRQAVKWARQIAEVADENGITGASGGAMGCDRLAQQAFTAAGAPFFEVLASGIQFARSEVALSARPPDEPFSPMAAHERNLLLYALGPTVILEANYMQGGTWAGATQALRARLGPIGIMPAPKDSDGAQAHRALVNLGVNSLESAHEVCAMKERAPLQPRFAL
ncbi:MAG: DNA-processing protein DprA [Armatimonadetes bacterium]|nr:DNA-processing protein DprA [Armatimonadota bacterium]